jgi:hypothetical protein
MRCRAQFEIAIAARAPDTRDGDADFRITATVAYETAQIAAAGCEQAGE